METEPYRTLPWYNKHMKNAKEGGRSYVRRHEHGLDFDTNQYPDIKYLYTALSIVAGVTAFVAKRFLFKENRVRSKSTIPSDVNKIPLINPSFPSVTGNRRHMPAYRRGANSHR